MSDGQSVAGGRYVLDAPLGRGGMAQVHRGTDIRLGRPVAVKLLSAHLAADPAAQARFRREAKAAASLNHPNIASVFDTGEDSDPTTGISIPYIVMELVEGPTLRQLLDDGGPLPPPRALEITQSVLGALAHSHDAGIIHRDIKPANVMLTPTDQVKVMDFGIARVIDDTSSLTQTAAVIGTAQYLSPEQASGKQLDLRSDLYSVGCLLFELLVGRPPFVGETSVSVAYQHVREAPVAPSQLNPAVSPELDAVVLKALSKNPDDRYQSAPEMAADLGRLLVGMAPDAGIAGPALLGAAAAAAPTAGADPTQTMPVGREEPRRSGAGRAVLITLSVLLLLGLGAFAIFQLLSPDDETASAVEVPSVIGSTRADAETQLRAANLVPEFKNVRGEDDATVGQAVNQNPLGTTEVEPQTVVTVEINVGPATAKIPNGLVGEDVDKVTKELEEAGFTSIQTQPVENPGGDVNKEEVLTIDPAEGESVSLDEDILIRYVADKDESESATPTSEPRDTKEPTASSEPTASEDETTTEPTRSARPTPKPTKTSASEEPTETPGSGEAPQASAKPKKSEKSKEPNEPKASEGPDVAGDN